MTKFKMYRTEWTEQDAVLVARTISESLHQSLDGWTEDEAKVIRAYLDDIALACQVTKDL